MGRVDAERLTRLLGNPELAWVLARVRRRLELGQPLTGTIALSSATALERDAIARLLGRAPRAGARGVSVSLAELDGWLRRSGVCEDGLVAAVAALDGGPVTVRAEAVAEDTRRWEQAYVRLAASRPDAPALVAWLAGVRREGLVKRLAGGDPDVGRELCDAVALVVGALGGASETGGSGGGGSDGGRSDGETLAAFSARVCGRAHALDEGSPLGTLALGAVRAITGTAAPLPGESAAEARREAWAAAGVLCDDLSSNVLTLGLPGDDGSVTGRMLSEALGGREPMWLTLRQLVRAPVDWRSLGLGEVLVVENPSVVALAASRAVSMPIVCTNGQPRAAAMMLLRVLADAGVALGHHGDFDWAGLTIGNLLQRRLPITARAFHRTAYESAVRVHRHAGPLSGKPVMASWDPALTDAMRTAGRQIEEELVAEELLASLG